MNVLYKIVHRNFLSKLVKNPKPSQRMPMNITSLCSLTLNKKLDGCHGMLAIALLSTARIDCNSLQNISENFIKNSLWQHTLFLEHTQLAEKIGKTPIKHLSNQVFLKLEGNNLTGTIKDRTALHVLLKKLEKNEIKDGDKIITASSGSYAQSLITVKREIEQYYSIKLTFIIMVPEIHKDKKWVMKLKNKGLNDIDEKEFSLYFASKKDTIIFTKNNFGGALKLAKKIASEFNFVHIDPQGDHDHIKAHESTARELVQQLPHVTDIVVTTGTGATAMGLFLYSPKSVRIHSRRAKTGTIGGIGDPSLNDGFFESHHFLGYDDHPVLNPAEAVDRQRHIMSTYNLNIGESTGAALSIVDDVKKDNPDAVVAVISASFAGDHCLKR